jgi:hypothetical protein
LISKIKAFLSNSENAELKAELERIVEIKDIEHLLALLSDSKIEE